MAQFRYTIPYQCPYCGGDGKGNHKNNCSNDPYKVREKVSKTEVPSDEEITKAINER